MNDPAANDAGPGFLAFVAFFLLALVLWFLMRNMNARMRRMSYRQQAAHRRNDEPQATESDLAAAAAAEPPVDLEEAAAQGPAPAERASPDPMEDQDDNHEDEGGRAEPDRT